MMVARFERRIGCAMAKKISPPQVLLLLALAPLGLLAPDHYKMWAVLGILIGCGLALWIYHSVLASELERGEEMRRTNQPSSRASNLLLHRGLCAVTLVMAAIAVKYMTRAETFEIGAIFTAFATAFWCLSRMVAEMFFDGAGNLSIFFGRAPILLAPPAGENIGPEKANFGPLGGGSAGQRPPEG